MVLNDKAEFSVLTEHSVPSDSQTAALDLVRNLPDVPVLSETLLLMELKIRERVVDLREVSNLVLSDLGATIQIMRMSASEDYSADCRITRIEDCISGLGLQACFDAMSRRPLKRTAREAKVVEAWLHARNTAENARFLAEDEYPNIHPDEAYLVGLLHALGTLPTVLGWSRMRVLPSDPTLSGLQMAEAWSFPHCVSEYFSGLRAPKSANRWTQIVGLAHQQADRSLLRCAAGCRLPSHVGIEAIQLVPLPGRFIDRVPERQIAFG